MPTTRATTPITLRRRARPGEPVHDGDAAETWLLLHTVWEQQSERVGRRVDLLEETVDALSRGALDPDLRERGERAAHMLAGSLGMFGFVGGSDAARALEHDLLAPARERVPAMELELRTLRREIRDAPPRNLAHAGVSRRASARPARS